MPLLVTSSRGVGWITTRSPRGLSFLLLAVAVANAQFLLMTVAGASRRDTWIWFWLGATPRPMPPNCPNARRQGCGDGLPPYRQCLVPLRASSAALALYH